MHHNHLCFSWHDWCFIGLRNADAIKGESPCESANISGIAMLVRHKTRAKMVNANTVSMVGKHARGITAQVQIMADAANSLPMTSAMGFA